MKKHSLFKITVAASGLLLLLLIAAALTPELFPGTGKWLRLFGESDLMAIKERGKIVVLTRNAPTTYYQGPNGPMGFEYDLVSAFAKHLGVTVEFKILGSIADILAAIQNGEGDIAAACITRTAAREDTYVFGPDYFHVQQQVVTHRANSHINELEDLLSANILIISDSSYQERLSELKQNYPALSWDTTTEMGTEQIMEMVAVKKIDCTVADSNIVSINRRYLPELEVAFPITEEQPLAWIIRKDAGGLALEIEEWFERFDNAGGLAKLNDKYYSHTEIFDFVDTVALHRRIETRLPRFEHFFKKTARKHDLDWIKLAAQAYQESHWNPKAKSPTGVRGIMMLTLVTAKSLGVTNRLDPEQSIEGGARYLSHLIQRVPEATAEKDRLKVAMAAYNVGMGHIHDARKLAKRLGKDPNTWQGLKTVLPLLSRKKYFQDLPYGYARGSEAVRYVERIINYQDIIRNTI